LSSSDIHRIFDRSRVIFRLIEARCNGIRPRLGRLEPPRARQAPFRITAANCGIGSL
jgi:hypothetical protein